MMKTDIPAAALPLLPSRKAIQRAALYPLPTIAVMGLLIGIFDRQYAAGIALSGSAVVVVGWIMARVALGKGHVHDAGSALLRLITAVMVKWLLLITLLAIGFMGWQLPPLALLLGLVVGLALQIRAFVKR